MVINAMCSITKNGINKIGSFVVFLVDITWYRIKCKINSRRHQVKLSATEWTAVGVVDKLYIYPYVWGKPILLSQCNFTFSGPTSTKEGCELRNNMFVIYNKLTNCACEDNNLMCQIDVRTLEHDVFIFQAPNMNKLYLHLKYVLATLCQYKKTEILESFAKKFIVKKLCYDCGDEAASWLSKILKDKNVRLGYIDKKDATMKKGFWQSVQPFKNAKNNKEILRIYQYFQVSFAEVPSYRLIGLQSFYEWRSKFTMKNIEDLDKFVPNVVIKYRMDCPSYLEDECAWIKIGNSVILRNIRPMSTPSDTKDLTTDMRKMILQITGELVTEGKVNMQDIVYMKKCQYQPMNVIKRFI